MNTIILKEIWKLYNLLWSNFFLRNTWKTIKLMRTIFTLTEILLRNRSSFLYGRKPAGTVPIYAVIKNCAIPDVSTDAIKIRNERNFPRKRDETLISSKNVLQIDDFGSTMIFTNDLAQKIWKTDVKQNLEVHWIKIL